MEKIKDRLNRLKDSVLYLLTPSDVVEPDLLFPMIIEAVRNGADIIQMRNKTATTRRLIETGIKISQMVHQEGALFIVNDRVDIALATDADGVHLGRDQGHVCVCGQDGDGASGTSRQDCDQ